MKKYKIILGTSLLMITSACQSPKKDNSEEVLCYEMPVEYEDTIHIQSHDSSDIMCYDVAIEPKPEIIPEVMCYEPASDVYVVVEQMPVFPGGDKELMNYIQEKMIYPKKALKDSIHGKVYVSFIVEKDGTLSEIDIVRGIEPDLDKEALRIIRTMPIWTPGKQRDKTVRVKYTLPVRFKLPDIIEK